MTHRQTPDPFSSEETWDMKVTPHEPTVAERGHRLPMNQQLHKEQKVNGVCE